MLVLCATVASRCTYWLQPEVELSGHSTADIGGSNPGASCAEFLLPSPSAGTRC
jgi:hypothetical protein